MGYYTQFKLEISEHQNEIMPKILEEFELDGIFDETGDCWDERKWYDHEAEMKVVSKAYPDVVFTLSGEGEESGDVWRKYFKNGKMQSDYAELRFEGYDEGKLR